jgi:radical SAM protein with 4Fe4S-binding SPASM domain
VGFASDARQLWLTKEEGAEAYKNLCKIVDNANIKMEMAHFPLKSQRKATFLGFSCLGANLYCFISANGSVAPCAFTSHQFPGGNIRQKSLRAIWAESELFRKFRGIVSGSEACAKCMRYATQNLNGEPVDKMVFVMPTATAAPASVS